MTPSPLGVCPEVMRTTCHCTVEALVGHLPVEDAPAARVFGEIRAATIVGEQLRPIARDRLYRR